MRDENIIFKLLESYDQLIYHLFSEITIQIQY